ncbi:MAG: phosphatidate cytidylyltransferase [Thermoleophilaceae bacterium]
MSASERRSTRARRRNQRSDLGARVLAAIPAVAFAIFIVAQGGLVFALGLLALGILAMHELYTLMDRVQPAKLAGFLALAGLLLAALYGDQFQILLALALAVPVTFFFALLRPHRENVSWAVAVTLLGVAWIGVALAHAVLLRELPHGGALVVDVLIGTFIGDTAAYFGGRAYGRHKIAPRISPSKTLEGLIAGIVGGTFAFWLFAISYQDFFDGKGVEALVIGFCVALAAPLGDLFESLIKRDLDVKDTGRFFGAHGGVLDRLDAVFFTAVTGYYVSIAVL